MFESLKNRYRKYFCHIKYEIYRGRDLVYTFYHPKYSMKDLIPHFNKIIRKLSKSWNYCIRGKGDGYLIYEVIESSYEGSVGGYNIRYDIIRKE